MITPEVELDDLRAWMSEEEKSGWPLVGIHTDDEETMIHPQLIDTSGDDDNSADMSVDEHSDQCSHHETDSWCLGDLLDFRAGDGLWRTGRIIDRDSRQMTIETRDAGNFIWHKPFDKSTAPAGSMVGTSPFRMRDLKQGDPVEIKVLKRDWQNGEVIGFGCDAQVLVRLDGCL